MKNSIVRINPLKTSAEKITSLIGMAKGFMFSRKTPHSKLFVMSREKFVDIHMFFVFFPLIIVWIGKNKRIKHFSKALPFLFYKVHKAKYVLEIPYSGKTFKKLKMGMRLNWKN